MTIGPINNSALFGIHRGFDNLNRSAQKIASATVADSTTTPRMDLERTLVSLKETSINIQTSTKAFATQDKLIGVLLDELA